MYCPEILTLFRLCVNTILHRNFFGFTCAYLVPALETLRKMKLSERQWHWWSRHLRRDDPAYYPKDSPANKRPALDRIREPRIQLPFFSDAE